MEAHSVTKHVRISPRKARLVLDLIRGKRVEEALHTLRFVPRKAALIIAKTVRAAVANAESTQNIDVDDLFVKRAFVDEGVTWKRFIPRAHGRATRVNKRTSHITVVVDGIQKG